MLVFSERLREVRKAKDVTQVQLGKMLDYGYTAIANYESGRNEPSHADLCRIADYLDVSIDYLLGRTDDLYSHKNYALYMRLKNTTLLDFLLEIDNEKFNL